MCINKIFSGTYSTVTGSSPRLGVNSSCHKYIFWIIELLVCVELAISIQYRYIDSSNLVSLRITMSMAVRELVQFFMCKYSYSVHMFN